MKVFPADYFAKMPKKNNKPVSEFDLAVFDEKLLLFERMFLNTENRVKRDCEDIKKLLFQVNEDKFTNLQRENIQLKQQLTDLQNEFQKMKDLVAVLKGNAELSAYILGHCVGLEKCKNLRIEEDIVKLDIIDLTRGRLKVDVAYLAEDRSETRDNSF